MEKIGEHRIYNAKCLGLYWDAVEILNGLIDCGEETKESLLARLDHDLGFDPTPDAE